MVLHDSVFKPSRIVQGARQKGMSFTVIGARAIALSLSAMAMSYCF
jgi:hypothetical protein